MIVNDSESAGNAFVSEPIVVNLPLLLRRSTATLTLPTLMLE